MPQLQNSPISSAKKTFRPGSYLYWQGQYYCILPQNTADPFAIHLEHVETSKLLTLRAEELLFGQEGDQLIIVETTLDHLKRAVEKTCPLLEFAPDAGIDEHLLKRADTIITTVITVEQLIEERKKEARLRGDKQFHRMDELEAALKVVKEKQKKNIRITTYYDFLKRYKRYSGDRVQIAASLNRSKRATPFNKAQLHFVDMLLLRFYAGERIVKYKPSFLFQELAPSILAHTDQHWVDPTRCKRPIPTNLVDDLLNHKLPMEAIQDNKEYKELLTKIELPSKSWFYNYLRWIEGNPGRGKELVIGRYGKEEWERAMMVFDTFVTRATFPLQYVFADHYLLDVFIVDEATRSKLDRLWLTVLIDAYSRSIVGIALLYEQPCIESIQSALQHAIWPKTSHTALGIEGEWGCYGIPQQLFLDNAWAHHSHSLENLARVISQNGTYDSITLVFRPPYMGRYGALVERFFGNVSNQIRQRLPGAIRSSDPKHVRNAAKEACLLYEDVYRFVHQLIADYQHTPRKELNGMTPNQKWAEGMQNGPPFVPALTSKIKRMFLRKSPATRVIGNTGVCAFGMHYWSPKLAGALRTDSEGKDIEYSFRYDPSDISSISLFLKDDFIDEIGAKELRRADGTLQELSLTEKEMAKRLAEKNGGTTLDWLAYVNEVRELTEKRTKEKKNALRKQREGVQLRQTPSPEKIKCDETTTPLTRSENDRCTDLLADFAS